MTRVTRREFAALAATTVLAPPAFGANAGAACSADFREW